GASVGGFTDCLLQNGATKVYAVDTAKELLHPSLKCKKENIVELLGVDARNLKNLPTKVDIVTVDVTFSSLKSILPNIKNYIKKEGDIIVLVKPLFETDFRKETRFKIINDFEILRRILWDLIDWNIANFFFPRGLIVSPLLGKGGSVEFLIHIRIDKEYLTDFEKIINEAFKDAAKFKF
ncbi:MAG: TlyA family rRNA (cytidine-2'-O)-methyltransferase, partial [Candidatus Lokiarchaeota archaeon]|nr:TlyA family rRNA (cytidine-2'-O)-methyltransferase [Candidatus Lokiarchaeota archaeon]